MTEGRKKARGVGAVYQPSYVVKASGERKTSSVWWVYYHHRGRLYRESSNSTKRGDATQLLRKRLAEVGQGRVIGPQAEKTTFEELAEMLVNDCLSGQRPQEHSPHSRCAGTSAETDRHGLRAVDISSDKITTYITHRQGEAPPLQQSTGICRAQARIHARAAGGQGCSAALRGDAARGQSAQRILSSMTNTSHP